MNLKNTVARLYIAKCSTLEIAEYINNEFHLKVDEEEIKSHIIEIQKDWLLGMQAKERDLWVYEMARLNRLEREIILLGGNPISCKNPSTLRYRIEKITKLRIEILDRIVKAKNENKQTVSNIYIPDNGRDYSELSEEEFNEQFDNDIKIIEGNEND